MVPLRPGVSHIDPDGTSRLAHGQVAVVVAVVGACSMIGFFLRGPDELAAAVEQFVRCDSLAAPARITHGAGGPGRPGGGDHRPGRRGCRIGPWSHPDWSGTESVFRLSLRR